MIGARVAAARAIAVAAVVIAGGALGSCRQARPPVVRPGPPPSAEQLLAALAARQNALRGMNARARATSWIGGDRLRATVLMLVERRGQLRIEAEVSLQGTVSILTTQVPDDAGAAGARFQLLDLRSNRLQQGPACPANVASLIRIPLASDEVAAILLGDAKVPRGISAADATVAWDAGRGADALVIRDGATERRIFFAPDGKSGEIVGASATGAAGVLWRSSYEDFVDAGAGLRLPSLIRFAERAGSFDDGVEIKLKDRIPNAEIRPDAFVIAPPTGAEVIEVGCGRAPG